MTKDVTSPKRVIFTVVANNYLPYARVLMQSVKQHTNDVQCVIFLCDRKQNKYLSTYNEIATEVNLICIEELEIDDFPTMAFCYSLIELCTAVKPFCANWLMDRGAPSLIYLDPDIKTYASLNLVFEQLEKNNIVLTPHLTDPILDSARPNHVDILRAGTYNLGFIGIQNSNEARRFLNWWSDKLVHQCINAPDQGLFVDQRWVDLAPGLFDGVLVSRHPGLNVAYWNLENRTLSKKSSTFLANDEPLIFIHYSGVNPKTVEFSHHQNRYSFSNLPPIVNTLAKDYIKEINEVSDSTPTKNYEYGEFNNGEIISDSARQVFRESDDSFEIKTIIQDDPTFLTKLATLLNAPAEDPTSVASTPLITRIAHHIYKTREDLQHRFKDLFGDDAEEFTDWLVLSNKSNNELPSECVSYLKSLLDINKTTKPFLRKALTFYHTSPKLKKVVLIMTNEKIRKQLLINLNRK